MRDMAGGGSVSAFISLFVVTLTDFLVIYWPKSSGDGWLETRDHLSKYYDNALIIRPPIV